MSQPQRPGAPTRPMEELSVLAGHARVFSTKVSEAPAYPSVTTNEFVTLAGDLHPSLMEDLNIMNQQDQIFPGMNEVHLSLSPEFDAATVGHLLAGSNMSQTGVPSDTLVGMFGNSAETFTPSGDQQPDYTAPSGSEWSKNEGVMDDLGDVFATACSDQRIWDSMREDVSWQGFIAGLGLSGAYN